MESQVSIKQSAADIKIIPDRLGIPRLIVPGMRNLRIPGTSRQESMCAFGGCFWFLIYECCRIAHAHMPKQTLCKLGKICY